MERRHFSWQSLPSKNSIVDSIDWDNQSDSGVHFGLLQTSNLGVEIIGNEYSTG